MTTRAQLAANRRNAKKSTGPKTKHGKAAAGRNAFKHGLLARDVVCAEESSQEYREFVEAVSADLAPVGEVEEQLVDRIATCTWRLQRMVVAEVSMFDHRPGYDELHEGESAYSRRFDRRTSEMIALSRYEASLDRSLVALTRCSSGARRGAAASRLPHRLRSSSRDCLMRSPAIRLSRSVVRRIMKSAKRTQFSTLRRSRREQMSEKAAFDAAKSAAFGAPTA